ncbi:MAG TPA: hypothetical protein VK770_07605 [Candidatus Acidoferrum sp.]|nr:hypothetical protein [Candidatus Acidoferrum sp.]
MNFSQDLYAGFGVCLTRWPFNTFRFFAFLTLLFFLAVGDAAGIAPAETPGTNKIVVGMESRATPDNIAARKSFITKILHYIWRLLK